MLRFTFMVLAVLAVLALAGCGGDGDGDDEAMRDTDTEVMRETDSEVMRGTDDEVMRDSVEGMTVEGPRNITPAERWWNALTAGQMVAALYGDAATAEQAASAQKMYAELDDDTRLLVDAAVAEIYDKEATYDSVGDWWQTLGCQPMRVAAGDGNTFDPASPYCTYYPGSGFTKILSDEARAHVDYVGMALLDRDDPGLFIPLVGRATHGIGTTLEYVVTYEDGTTTQLSFEYTGYEVYRGRDVLVVEDSQPGSASPTQYWDLETGNWAASFDADGEVVEEQIPHNGTHAFPMVVGTGPQFVSAYCEGECPRTPGLSGLNSRWKNAASSWRWRPARSPSAASPPPTPVGLRARELRSRKSTGLHGTTLKTIWRSSRAIQILGTTWV